MVLQKDMVRESREEWNIYENVFDKFTIRTLWKLSSKGLFADLESPIAIGKESNVFLARDKNDNPLIVKIYRLENCNFNKMYFYIKNDPRFLGLENRRRKVIFKWVQREYRNLLKAREKIRVPTPIEFKDNVLVMEMIGEGHPSPVLKDKDPEDPERFMEDILDNMEDLMETGVIHGDLSHFNIINYDEKPVFIDFSQGTSIKASEAPKLLKRDIKNIYKFFKRHTDKEKQEIEERMFTKLEQLRESDKF